MALPAALHGQSPPDVRRYAIEVAGVRVGTMTATRQTQADGQLHYTLISDVKVNFLVYKLTIFYKVDNYVRQGQLLRSTVETHTNRGDFSSVTEWKGDHYDIRVKQYKHNLTATERARIDYTVTDLYFNEPTTHARAYSEYFGNYFALSRTPKGTYLARQPDQEHEYVYKNKQLVKVIKKNALKNFIIRLL